MSEFKKAQKLSNADIFELHDVNYVVLSSFSDERHTYAIITAHEIDGDVSQVVVLFLYKELLVKVVRREPSLRLKVIMTNLDGSISEVKSSHNAT